MPTYDVSITRTLQLSTTITVRAKTEDEAEEKALAQIEESVIEWKINDKRDWNEDNDDCVVESIDPA
jgi:hypothetical protein